MQQEVTSTEVGSQEDVNLGTEPLPAKPAQHTFSTARMYLERFTSMLGAAIAALGGGGAAALPSTAQSAATIFAAGGVGVVASACGGASGSHTDYNDEFVPEEDQTGDDLIADMDIKIGSLDYLISGTETMFPDTPADFLITIQLAGEDLDNPGIGTVPISSLIAARSDHRFTVAGDFFEIVPVTRVDLGGGNYNFVEREWTTDDAVFPAGALNPSLAAAVSIDTRSIEAVAAHYGEPVTGLLIKRAGVKIHSPVASPGAGTTDVTADLQYGAGWIPVDGTTLGLLAPNSGNQVLEISPEADGTQVINY